MTEPMITAHSGCEETPTDSLESIDKALEFGADAIEVDVRVDQNGELRISHNAVSQEEYYKKVNLETVFGRIRFTDLAVNFDIKEQAALYKTLEEAEKLGFPRERLIFSGCTGPEQLARDPHLAERGRFFLNIEEVMKFVHLRKSPDLDIEEFSVLMNDPWAMLREKAAEIPEGWIEDTVKLYRMLHAEAANISKKILGTPLVDALIADGFPLSVWTVNEPDTVRQCLDLKVFNITTRKVRQAMELRSGQ
ncbi:MAG: glycerophosphodiester phosphodiesterase [Flexilinea sp.]|nr:glycerophosphodiester phosphodiesterase [Flexilinea sp.]